MHYFNFDVSSKRSIIQWFSCDCFTISISFMKFTFYYNFHQSSFSKENGRIQWQLKLLKQQARQIETKLNSTVYSVYTLAMSVLYIWSITVARLASVEVSLTILKTETTQTDSPIHRGGYRVRPGLKTIIIEEDIETE